MKKLKSKAKKFKKGFRKKRDENYYERLMSTSFAV